MIDSLTIHNLRKPDNPVPLVVLRKLLDKPIYSGVATNANAESKLYESVCTDTHHVAGRGTFLHRASQVWVQPRSTLVMSLASADSLYTN